MRWKLIIVNLFILLIVVTGLYWIVSNHEASNNERFTGVNSQSQHSRGVIKDLTSYKGHSITLEYTVAGKNYTYNGGWDSNPKNLQIGDSINLRYSLNNPKQVITELEDEF